MCLWKETPSEQGGHYGKALTTERAGILQDYICPRQSVKPDGIMLCLLFIIIIFGSEQIISEFIILPITALTGLLSLRQLNKTAMQFIFRLHLPREKGYRVGQQCSVRATGVQAGLRIRLLEPGILEELQDISFLLMRFMSMYST